MISYLPSLLRTSSSCFLCRLSHPDTQVVVVVVSAVSGRRRDLRTVFRRRIEVSEGLREARALQAGQQRGPADAAVRVLVAEPVPERAAARQAAGEVGQEVTAEDHVDPGVAAAVEAGQQGGERHRGVLRVCRETQRRRFMRHAATCQQLI